MFDKHKLDDFFENISKKEADKTYVEIYQNKVRRTKILLPLFAAFFVGLLLIIPSLKKEVNELSINIKKPTLGNIDELHVENLEFYITDKDNKVSKFYTSNIDETSPKSKLIVLTKPEGIINASEDSWLSVKSNSGLYNQNTNILDLDENIEVFISDGMMLETMETQVDFTKGKTYGRQKVVGSGDLGELEAEGFEIFNKDKIIIFKGKTSIKINGANLKGKKNEN